MNKEQKEEFQKLLKEFEKESGLSIPENMIDDGVRIESEAKYFVDYLDARFEALKMPEVYRLPLCILIVQEMLAFIFKDKEPEIAKELVTDIVEGALAEHQQLNKTK